ncbi:type II toxin-antitoxin system RelE/ParE family toxin [Azospirillum sp.]|uniref:type II toxin-antitoxin system RelE/ParE family toxin n=1 Tax=Azospirillum sp. TaxID=34012 RepID=UPI002D6B9176|nr:type II toxin-antitoxin system RelE/ParE family toxin [Azospirillum sp.]HYD70919.1 type II toxin-antitoxin system RelE/ParE family toxin [Azospirillum sp.]
MMRVRWTGPARRDFLGICDWIDARNPQAAERVGRRILDVADRLAALPGMGRTGRVEGTREFAVPGLPYVIVYANDDGESVVILRVLHGAMRWPPEK